MRSRRAHSAQTLGDEVQRCTARSGAGKEDWRDTWQRGLARKRIGEEKEEEKKEKKEKKKEKQL